MKEGDNPVERDALVELAACKVASATGDDEFE
jgi:hypothetical protein